MGSLGQAKFTRLQLTVIFLFCLHVYSNGQHATTSGHEATTKTEWNTMDAETNNEWLTSMVKQKTTEDHNEISAGIGYTRTRNLERGPNDCSLNKRKMDCSHCDLETVPKPLAPDIEYLDLSDNLIPDLPDRVFSGYPNLLVLDLSSNNLSSLNNFSFYGLTQLTHLKLWNNSLLLLPTTFPDNVFVPLHNLVHLKINKNTKVCNGIDLSYPDKAIATLKNLKYLAMDGLVNDAFGPGFKNLSGLTNLTLAGYLDGYCCLHSVKNRTFQNLKNLKYLDLNNCNIYGSRVEAGGFEPLSELEVLNLSHNENLEFEGLKNILYGLRNSKLKNLNIQLITDRYSFGFCLSNDTIQYLPKTVEYLDVRENSLYAVDRQVIGKLSPAMKEMDISGNMFGFGTYFQDLKLMHNLTKLRVNGASYVYSLPTIYPYHLTAKIEKTAQSCMPFSVEKDYILTALPFVLLLPPNVKSIEMNNAGLRYKLTKLTVHPDNKLEQLSMRGNFFLNLEGPFNGLHSLKYLDLSSSSIQSISDNFFVNLTALQTLNLGYNFIGELLSENPEADPFSMLSNLKTLNLSFNTIETLPDRIFSGLTHLESLILSRNPILNFSVDLSNLQHLKVLNLSYTNLAGLPPSTRKHIDNLLHRNVSIQVDMSKSPIVCRCENLEFLEWLVVSTAFNGNFSNYDCVNMDSSRSSMKYGYNETLSILRRHCVTHDIMLFSVTASTLVLLIILLGLVIYRFRWKLRYFYYAAYVYYFKRGTNTDIDQFTYDTFISYDHTDERFVRRILSPELQKRGLKLCIHGRDFTAGDQIASNIVNAICSSRKTLVVLTNHLIKSYWCTYEIQMANMESVHTGRRILVFLLMEKLVHNIDTQLRYNISNNTYIAYPDQQAAVSDVELLWDKLALDLRN